MSLAGIRLPTSRSRGFPQVSKPANELNKLDSPVPLAALVNDAIELYDATADAEESTIISEIDE